MKKNTGIVFLVAAALAAFVYFYDLKHTKSNAGDIDTESANRDEDKSKPVFSFPATDVTTLTIERDRKTVILERRKDDFYITQPIATRAEQSVVGAITGELQSVRVTRSLPATPDQLATYGLDHPKVTLAIKLQNNATHRLRLGGKDFSGMSVYALVDDDKQVSLMSDAILTSTDKPVDEIRDQSVLNFVSNQATSFDLKNQS